MISSLIRNLERQSGASSEGRQALSDAIGQIRTFARGEDLVSERVDTTDCLLLVQGLACRYKMLDQERRQILSFHIQGDICNLQALWLPMDHNVGAMTECRAALLPQASLRAIIRDYPHVGDALWRLTLIEGAVYREWMIGMGRRSSFARVAHLFCEILARYHAMGLLKGDQVDWPITQADLADALGLSIVHVNRVLQQLRRQELVILRGRTLVISDWEGLRTVAGFDPAYLHLGSAPA